MCVYPENFILRTRWVYVQVTNARFSSQLLIKDSPSIFLKEVGKSYKSSFANLSESLKLSQIKSFDTKS